MQKKRGVIAVADSLVGVGLLAIDAWGRISQLSSLPWWRYVQPWLPTAYGLCFLVALVLLRAEYENADYDFVIDPETEYVREAEESYCYSDTYRVSVLNKGNVAINAQVILRGILPEWSEYAGKLGMPLIAMGEPPTTEPIQINPKDRRAFNLVTHHFDASAQLQPTDDLFLWHKWDTAPKELPVVFYDRPEYVCYVFELVLTVSEGPIKTARYQFQRDTSASAGLDYRLSFVRPPALWTRMKRRFRLMRGEPANHLKINS